MQYVRSATNYHNGVTYRLLFSTRNFYWLLQGWTENEPEKVTLAYFYSLNKALRYFKTVVFRKEIKPCKPYKEI